MYEMRLCDQLRKQLMRFQTQDLLDGLCVKAVP